MERLQLKRHRLERWVVEPWFKARTYLPTYLPYLRYLHSEALSFLIPPPPSPPFLSYTHILTPTYTNTTGAIRLTPPHPLNPLTRTNTISHSP